MIKDNQDGTFSIVRPKVWDDEPVAFVTGVRQFDPVMADTVLKVGTPLYTHPSKDLTDEEILAAIKSIADDVSPHKEYENTYSDGWLDACNTVYDEVFAILRKAQENAPNNL